LQPQPVSASLTLGGESGKPAPARKLVAAERREIGGISLGSYVMFVRACGGLLYWALFAAAYLGTQALDLGSAWWLRRWTSANATDRSEVQKYLLVYALITFAGVAGSAVRCKSASFSLSHGGLRPTDLAT
jgi:hypothetical protein